MFDKMNAALYFLVGTFAFFIKYVLAPFILISSTSFLIILFLYIFSPAYKFSIQTSYNTSATYADNSDISSDPETDGTTYTIEYIAKRGFNFIRAYTTSFFGDWRYGVDKKSISYNPISSWLSACLREGGVDKKTTPIMTSVDGLIFRSSPLSPLANLIGTQSTRLLNQIDASREELAGLRSTSYLYLTIAAVVGFLTTVIAAANAWAPLTSFWGSTLKLLGVALPAAGTLIVALASIYAPADTVSRKAQLVSGLITLQGELSAIIAENGCVKVTMNDQNLAKTIGDWNKRFATAVAAAELSQSPGSPAREGQVSPKDAQTNPPAKPGLVSPMPVTTDTPLQTP